MKKISISISDQDYTGYGFDSDNLTFSEMEEKIKKKTIRDALYKCQKIAEEKGLSNMTMDDIKEEINAVRANNAKNNN